ncbi:MAG: DUF6528 family protein [bacterium]
MKFAKLILPLFLALVLQSCSSKEKQIPKELFICDQNSKKVLLLNINSDWNDSSKVFWSWSASESPEIPEQEKGWYDYLAEAKPVKQSSHLLIVGGSGGGVALVRIADKKVVFHAYGGESPHSAELLPDGNIVVASSQDNHLRLFYEFPDSSKYMDMALPSAHGVVWDFKRNQLWALGLDTLYAVKHFATIAPALSIAARYALPTHEGHDLFPRKNGKTLFVTTKTAIYDFDPQTGAFRPFEPLSKLNDVKSIAELSDDGDIAVVQGISQWWSDTVLLFKPELNKRMDGARFYKARWNTTNSFSYGHATE